MLDELSALTEVMVAAGAAKLEDYIDLLHDGFAKPTEVAAAVYKAMNDARVISSVPAPSP